MVQATRTATRIATWNVNSIRVRMPRLTEWLLAAEPDILCLQETKIDDEGFDEEVKPVIAKLGYESAHYGKKGGRNGVAILSRVGIKDVSSGFAIDGVEDPDARMVWATCGDIRIGSGYIPNGRELGHDHYFYKLEWFGWLKKQVEAELKAGNKKLVIVGDFNVAPLDIDVWDMKAFTGTTHTSPEERKAWEAVLAVGLKEVFRQRYPKADKVYSYWDYTSLRFPKNQGMRIDHIMASDTLADKLAWSIIDRNARKGEKPSDHTPVVAEFKE